MKSISKFLWLGIFLLTIIQCSVQTSENTSIKTLMISADQRDCTSGVMKTKCMLVREKITDEWQLFYNNIDGFTYEPGYDYVITVNTAKIANPPADASSIKYTLIRQISKVKRQ